MGPRDARARQMVPPIPRMLGRRFALIAAALALTPACGTAAGGVQTKNPARGEGNRDCQQLYDRVTMAYRRLVDVHIAAQHDRPNEAA